MVSAIILTLIALAFVLIVIEDIIHVNKAKTTLFFGTLCWIILFISPLNGLSPENIQHQLDHNILEIATLWLFLMAAMTFVAYLNSKGFIQWGRGNKENGDVKETNKIKKGVRRIIWQKNMQTK